MISEKFVFPEAFVMNESIPARATNYRPFVFSQKPLGDSFTPPFLFVLLL